MKRVTITYHMENRSEVAETCITLPMEDDIAKDVLRSVESSIYLQMGRNGHIRRILTALSTVQGYEYLGACHAEEAGSY